MNRAASRFSVLQMLILLLCFGNSANAAESTSIQHKLPNVILIVADDQGYHDLGIQGATDVKTPNIDRLAAGGVRFTQAYVTCPVCSPSRAGLLTGRYQERFGHEFNPGPNAPADFGLPTSEKTLANYLKAAGYATAAVGKWHLGYREEFQPLHRGFDNFYGFAGGNHSYVPQGKQVPGNEIMRNTTPVEHPPYLTTAFNSEAIQFLDYHHDGPFFLYLAYNAIHTPMQAAPGLAERFPDIKQPRRLTMATMLAALDDGVGEILDRLKRYHLDEDTLVIYISDNGGPTPTNASRNDPLRGFKGGTLEGGIRIPMIIRWPAKLPKDTVYDKPVISLDVLPTVLDAVGTSAPTEAKIDGVDLLPYLTGKKADTPHKSLFWRYGTQFAVRSGDWKLVRTIKEPTKLYNLAKDIGENQDLSTSEPEKLRQLQAEYDKWNAGNVPPRWPEYRADAVPAAADNDTSSARPHRRARQNAINTTATENIQD